MTGVDVRGEIAGEAFEPIVPGRLRKPLALAIENAMGDPWTADVGRWLFEHRASMVVDARSPWRAAYDLIDFGAASPDLAAPLRAAVLDRLDEGLEACGIAEFDLVGFDVHASLFHHGGICAWSDGIHGDDECQRRIGFELMLQQDPKMFSGGELEFLDGSTIEPRNGLLVFTNPVQTKRVREVECWSMHPIHGRWSIWGWLLGPAPEGWADRVRRMRCAR